MSRWKWWASSVKDRMPHTGITFVITALIIVGLGGCSTTQQTQRTTTVHYVQIHEQVAPRTLSVNKGDEIRWHNLSPSPVQIGILDTKWREHVICEKGFKRFGQVEDLVIIQPQEYVSLCFSKAGSIQYNVWLDPKNLTGSMSPTSTIRVD